MLVFEYLTPEIFVDLKELPSNLLFPSSDRLALLQVRSILQGLGLDCTCDDAIIVKEVKTFPVFTVKKESISTQNLGFYSKYFSHYR